MARLGEENRLKKKTGTPRPSRRLRRGTPAKAPPVFTAHSATPMQLHRTPPVPPKKKNGSRPTTEEAKNAQTSSVLPLGKKRSVDPNHQVKETQVTTKKKKRRVANRKKEKGQKATKNMWKTRCTIAERRNPVSPKKNPPLRAVGQGMKPQGNLFAATPLK